MALVVSLARSLALLAVLYFVYAVLIAIYRLFFHPLAKVPGPKLAAVTTWYETYFDVYPHVGQYTLQIKDMHAKYGPIVRIGPNQVNINDIDYMDTIYPAANRKRDRKKNWEWATASPNSMFATVGHDLHRKRRSALHSYFSKGSIRSLEDVIKQKVDRLCERLAGTIPMGDEQGPIVRMDTAYTALTADIITQYSYGKSWGFLDKDDFDQNWKDGMQNAWTMIIHFQNFNWFGRLASSLPDWLLLKLNPKLDGFVRLTNDVGDQVTQVLDEEKTVGRKTIFHELRDSDLPAVEKTHQKLLENGMVFVAAGTETTARALYLITFYLLNQPKDLKRLREELRSSLTPEVRKSPSLADLEKLPFLSAIVTEGLRIHGTSTNPNGRIAPDEVLQYGQYTLPPGTAVSAIAVLMSFDEKLFPEPTKFKPERWIGADPKMKSNEMKLAFGTGGRACLGMNLALAELYFAVALVLSKFDMELVDTTEDDVAIKVYSIGPAPKDDSNGVRVRVKGRVED